MKQRYGWSVFALLALGTPLVMAAGHRSRGAWLHRVPVSAHAQQSPIPGANLLPAAAAGGRVFNQECAHCHGGDGMGRGSRPPVVSPLVAGASDGDLFWLLKNGNPWHGMPPWQSLPSATRWQIVAYLRELNMGEDSRAGRN